MSGVKLFSSIASTWQRNEALPRFGLGRFKVSRAASTQPRAGKRRSAQGRKEEMRP